jgi:hypothetical protein
MKESNYTTHSQTSPLKNRRSYNNTITMMTPLSNRGAVDAKRVVGIF